MERELEREIEVLFVYPEFVDLSELRHVRPWVERPPYIPTLPPPSVLRAPYSLSVVLLSWRGILGSTYALLTPQMPGDSIQNECCRP